MIEPVYIEDIIIAVTISLSILALAIISEHFSKK